MIKQETIEAISTQINVVGHLDDTVIGGLRAQFEGVHFTYCSDDDVTDMAPILENELFNIYLVNGHDHCLKMTDDFAAATGVVVAEIYPE